MRNKIISVASALTIVLGITLTAHAQYIVPNNFIAYRVIYGDSLWKISQRYNTTVEALKNLNNLSSDLILVNQVLMVNQEKTTVPDVRTVNYKVVPGDTLWAIANKYRTSIETIKKSNMLISDYLMPNQIITVPVNSSQIVSPAGISMMKVRVNNNYGDIYTWENAMRLWTVDTRGRLKDLKTGKWINIKYYGGSNHSDIVSLTKADTETLKSIFKTWSWSNERPMVLYFSKNGTSYQMAVSVTGMPHSTTNIYDNDLNGHLDMYFYNSTSHNTNQMSSQHQANVLKANGQ